MEKPHIQIQEILNRYQNDIAEKIVEKQYSKAPDLWNKYGEEGKKKSIRDAAYHIPFLSESIILQDKETFTDYVDWVKHLFKEINLPENTMTETLECMKEVLQEYLTQEQFKIARDYIDAGINQMNEPLKDIQSYFDPNTHLGKLAKNFNELLLQGKKNHASKLIMDEVEKGTSIKDIYLHVFQVSQLETGRLWLMNKINVAKEHYVSAATQMIMSQLYPWIFSTERKGKVFLGACVGGELHELGIRMVSDFFEMDGWDTYHLGANTPANTIIEAIREYNADIVGLSIAMPYQRSTLKSMIQQIKSNLNEDKPKILVGGNGLNHRKELWKTFDADGYAPDAQKAVDLANQLIMKQ